VPAFGQRELSKITPVMVRNWCADLATQTPGVARSSYRLLRAIFDTAISDDLILKNPCRVKGGGTDKVIERCIPDVNQVANNHPGHARGVTEPPSSWRPGEHCARRGAQGGR